MNALVTPGSFLISSRFASPTLPPTAGHFSNTAYCMPGTTWSMPNSGSPVTILTVVDAGDARAEQLVVLAVLQLQRFFIGHRQRGRLDGELAVAELAVARTVNDGAVCGRALGFCDAPFLRGSRDQHRARRGAGAPQHVPVRRNRARAAGDLPPVDRRVDRACSTLTFDQSASSSSAMIIGKEVFTPWPISGFFE